MSYYFIFLDPIEESYNSEDDTVDYKIVFQKLPSNILDWFKNLWTADLVDAYLHATLGCDCPPGLWSIYEEAEDRPEGTFKTQVELFTWLKENLAVERDILTNPNSLVVGSTMEFDCEYAWFNADAVRHGELGKYLQNLVIVDNTGEVKVNTNKVRLSSYL